MLKENLEHLVVTVPGEKERFQKSLQDAWATIKEYDCRFHVEALMSIHHLFRAAGVDVETERPIEEVSERQRHLSILCAEWAKVIDLETWCDFGYWGNDTKRPFGFSGTYTVYGQILEFCHIEPEGQEDGNAIFTDSQYEYAEGLWKDLGDEIKRAIKKGLGA